ncbi:SDR family oxidoreductase [Actinospica sp. MGRD01-02]|uniref:SDR family oxidoreductase n=1 Tax=Actinospica acidithermotolerans TaxID=2828514 RepID=A0A941E739_9ACTN|nr:SDR family NAD(P)-dependent oxidoreductase [Actinospica acidithermotolerans]MBR7825677.1 SDR family oxidoreductase [Actinospica acidithermotolerans]
MTERNLAFLDGALKDKVAIVTGAGQGVGRDTAIAMTQAGARVAVIDINGENAAKVAAELADHGAPGLGITCDVSKRDQVEAAVAAAVAEFGGLDIVFNGAHNLRVVTSPFMETSEDLLHAHLHSGFYGTYYFMQAAYPHLKERGGSIINVGSGAGVKGNAEHLAYAATKEAIRAATRVAAREWGQDGIRVNTICPAAWDTPGMLLGPAGADDATKERMRAMIPLRRFAGGNETASVAVFLASDAASYMTGHSFMVDGGSNIDAGR